MPSSKQKQTRIAVGVFIGVLVVFAVLAVAFRPTTVPDVRTMPLAEATTLIEQAGLVVGTSSRVATAALGEGRVVSQSPEAGAAALSRSSVDVTTSVSPANLPVPDVVGASADDAAQTLTDALYVAVPVDIFDADLAIGEVVEQVPPAGFGWLTGRPVAFAVVAGPDDGTAVEVPDVQGDTIDAALAKIAAAGLASQGLVRDISAPDANVVVDQLPDAGVKVRPGTTVLLLFSTP